MSKSLDRIMEQLDANQEYIDRVEHCQLDNGELNGWEDEFLESLKDQLESGKEMSEKQLETLEKIEYKVEWGEKTYWEEFGSF